MASLEPAQLVDEIRSWGLEYGFQQVGISDTDLAFHHRRLDEWLDRGFHGAMDYMARHRELRCHPDKLLPGTRSVICLRMDYAPAAGDSAVPRPEDDRAYVARYARGRDYHKLVRRRATQLARRIEERIGPFGYRAFVDSAPVLERALAEKAGLGWIGKNTMLINRKAGSWFFLAEIFTDLPLPPDQPEESHCGSCRACLDVCPTGAFVGPNQLDARKCISYLTIESKTAMPVDLRPLMGNRIFGCDDCQLVCPWNKFAGKSKEGDFAPRHSLDDVDLLALFDWSEEQFLQRTEGSAIRRAGYEGWLRNIAVALGNAKKSPAISAGLERRLAHPSPLVREHVEWALQRQREA